jgi:hypothetical protein
VLTVTLGVLLVTASFSVEGLLRDPAVRKVASSGPRDASGLAVVALAVGRKTTGTSDTGAVKEINLLTVAGDGRCVDESGTVFPDSIPEALTAAIARRRCSCAGRSRSL